MDEANQIKKIDGSTDDVDHDAAGNMIRVPKLDGSGDHFHLVYDAWNRLVEVYDDNGTTLIAQYQYDGTGRRIVKGVDDGTDGSLDTFTHYFHNGAQVIETREGDDVSGAAPAAESLEPRYQNIWSPRYVDSLILRDEYDTQGDIIMANRVYYLCDANYNVTALVDASGNVIERYLYTPYGTVTVLDPDFSVDADGKSDYDNTTLYTGREFDPETELMYYRARYYHSELGRFISRDPIGYWGGMTLYEYVDSRPIFLVDPFGLAPPESNNDGDTGLSLSDRFKRFVDQLGTPSGSNGPSFGLPLTEALESGAPLGEWSSRWGIGFSNSGGSGISVGSNGVRITGGTGLGTGSVDFSYDSSNGVKVGGKLPVGPVSIGFSYDQDSNKFGIRGAMPVGPAIVGLTYDDGSDKFKIRGAMPVGPAIVGLTYDDGSDKFKIRGAMPVGPGVIGFRYDDDSNQFRISGGMPVGPVSVFLSACPKSWEKLLEDWEIIVDMPFKNKNGGFIFSWGSDKTYTWDIYWPFGPNKRQ